jgi:hypothetical protein
MWTCLSPRRKAVLLASSISSLSIVVRFRQAFKSVAPPNTPNKMITPKMKIMLNNKISASVSDMGRIGAYQPNKHFHDLCT